MYDPMSRGQKETTENRTHQKLVHDDVGSWVYLQRIVSAGLSVPAAYLYSIGEHKTGHHTPKGHVDR